MIPIYIMGKQYIVPESLTIMKAIEYSGFKYTRGCGCRGGICGACATFYRIEGNYKLKTGSGLPDGSRGEYDPRAAAVFPVEQAEL